MKKLLELGEHYVSDFLNESDLCENKQKYSLDLYLDSEIDAPKLKTSAPLDSMYGKYWYRSGINTSMTNQLRDIVNQICSRTKFKKDDIWLDIACNDGTLLKNVPNEFIKLGIDPADNSYYQESSKVATVIQDYFSEETYKRTGYGDKKCKVITIIAMFYDIENPIPVIKDLYKILDDDGLLVLHMSYTPLMINQLAFDNICHEHIYYYSLTSIKKLFNNNGFNAVDCELNDTNGGSFRIYFQKNTANKSTFGSAPLRDVCNFRIESILSIEKEKYDISSEDIWSDFGNKLNQLKEKTVSFIREEKNKGKKIYGYGASTKGNTLLQYFGLDHTLIDAIAERSPYKFGLKTVGTNIPIISEEEMRTKNPDYLLILPWHFIDEFEMRESEFIKKGGKLIVPCPVFKIIG
jgi:ubiquinone/menaquinone biosynthesis C-methylase UbiE